MTITWNEAKHIMDAMAMVFCRTWFTLTGEEPSVSLVEGTVRGQFQDFCDEYDIDEVEEEENEPDIPNDVDETNYDPYAGCEVYETDNSMDWY